MSSGEDSIDEGNGGVGSDCKGSERGRGGSEDSSGNGSMDDVSCGKDSSESKGGDKGSERHGGNGSWLGISKVGSKDLRHADKGTRFIAGTGGRPGGDSGSKGRTGFGKLRVSGSGTVARRS